MLWNLIFYFLRHVNLVSWKTEISAIEEKEFIEIYFKHLFSNGQKNFDGYIGKFTLYKTNDFTSSKLISNFSQ